MKPFTDVQAVLQFVASFEGSARDFQLPIDNSLQDPVGINMAIIVERILARRWEPAGYDQMDGYRIYRYKEWASCGRE
jgi:hypothetical protein